jgi:hypothetical protein
MVAPNRIYVTGFSNGAAMTFRVGAELSDRVAATAPVANSLLVKVNSLHETHYQRSLNRAEAVLNCSFTLQFEASPTQIAGVVLVVLGVSLVAYAKR